jgi:hypothetical protein
MRSPSLKAALLIAAGALFRFWAMNHARFTGDESEFWALARRMARLEAFPAYGPAITGAEARHPGALFFYLIALAQTLGDSPRFGSALVVVLHAIAAWVLYVIARRARGERAGLIALLLVMLAPWDVLYADRIWLSNVAPVVGTIAIGSAILSSSSTKAQAILLASCLVLPQFHMSAPIAWCVCAVILLLRPPEKWSLRALGAGVLAAVIAYAPPLWLELTQGLPNTRRILAQAGGNESLANLARTPAKVFSSALIFGSSDISYHFARGYWFGFDDIHRYWSIAGWSEVLGRDGWTITLLNGFSLLAALVAWICALSCALRRSRQALILGSRSALEDGDVLTLALLAGFSAATVLLVSAHKYYYPHYANMLMPVALWPLVKTADGACKRSWHKAMVLSVLGAIVVSMGASCVRYYRNVDALNGLAATLDESRWLLEAKWPFRLAWDGFNNEYALQNLSSVIHRRGLPLNGRSSLVYRVHNTAPFDGAASGGSMRFDRVLVERIGGPKEAETGDLLLDAKADWKRAEVWSVTDRGRMDCADRPETSALSCTYGEQSWYHYGPDFIDVLGRAEPLLYIHPIAGGVVTWKLDLPQGARRGVLSYAMSDGSTRSDNRSPVELSLVQGRQILARASADNSAGLKTVPFALSSTAAKEIALELRTEKDGSRVIGFDVEIYSH